MKIALIHYRLILRGGLETRLINYVDYLRSSGHEVDVIVSKRSQDVRLPSDVRVHVLPLGLVPKMYRQRYFDRRVGAFMRRHRFDLSISLMRTSHQDMVLCPGNHLGFLKSIDRRTHRPADREQDPQRSTRL